ncbi:MAG: electron transfer flavoprotein subunit alpha/FixB family protein [Clostridiales Family XIII bacterium]|jgi:electron transfer flavoprotein alpha subunit|nr:electron transfer flavoprotein subunit alpha/FixB family protein [Clostridiales Family XIII bacterium]
MKVCAVIVSSQHEDAQIISRLYSAAAALGADDPALWLIDDCGAGTYKCPFAKIIHAVPNAERFYSAEGILPVLSEIYDKEKPELMLFPADIAGSELGTRFSAKINTACITNIRSTENADTSKVVLKMAYSGNIDAVFPLMLPAVVTVMTDAFEPAEKICEPVTDTFYCTSGRETDWSADEEFIPAETGVGLRSFQNVIACGRGMGCKSNMEEAERLAERINGAVAGTRPAAVDGWVAPDRLVGISGAFISPKICLTLGASGARAFTTGIKDSEILIGVNTDETAPIFSVCDAGAVCDCVEFAHALADIIDAET